ncbi:hypothetical protein M3Y95_01011500 [Aphelenchoides besseyi]|nr:hypothetical protein M3Y95_01011500 [Aphelenchoides besseyi]
MTETNDLQINRNYMGKFELAGDSITYSPEGRFIIWKSIDDLTVADLFHTKTKSIYFDFSTATFEGSPLKTNNKRISVKSTFAFDLNTVLLLFTLHDSKYLGYGEVDLKCLKVFIKQTVKITFHFRLDYSKCFPLSYPPNLYDGVILKVYDFLREGENFTVKMGTNEDLQVSQLNVPMGMTHVGCFDGVLYGLVYNDTARRINQRQQIDLVKFSLSSGTNQQSTGI